MLRSSKLLILLQFAVVAPVNAQSVLHADSSAMLVIAVYKGIFSIPFELVCWARGKLIDVTSVTITV
jgi:hypothetical protein